ncbi:unnamed protein product [Polarella glacialis]|uniref:Uncharacterized protein n=1 Tax=Polarella glacialis TaxID=89957 RepID=A0A813KUR5_POLGL|nr:unnamed protein product [Polarella glacialis]
MAVRSQAITRTNKVRCDAIVLHKCENTNEPLLKQLSSESLLHHCPSAFWLLIWQHQQHRRQQQPTTNNNNHNNNLGQQIFSCLAGTIRGRHNSIVAAKNNNHPNPPSQEAPKRELKVPNQRHERERRRKASPWTTTRIAELHVLYKAAQVRRNTPGATRRAMESAKKLREGC